MAARIACLVAAAANMAVCILYLAVALGETDPNPASTYVVVPGALALGALLAAISAFSRDRDVRIVVLGSTIVITGAMAFLAASAIGPLLFPSFLLLLFAAVTGPGPEPHRSS